MRGWVSLHRKILDNPVVCKDAEYFSIWCYLLLNATHDSYDIEFKGKRISLKEGQLLTGRKAIASKFKISESKVQRVLKKLEIEQQIEQQTSTKNRLVTILNWVEYQESNNKTTTSEQQVNTNNNVNNVNNKDKADFDEIRKLFKGTKVIANAKKKLPLLIKKYGAEKIKQAVINYDDYVTNERRNGFKELKYMNESTFWNGRYEDYLDEVVKPIVEVDRPKVEKVKRWT